MHKIFTQMRRWLAESADSGAPADPLDRMSPCELADLPPYHPRFEPRGARAATPQPDRRVQASFSGS